MSPEVALIREQMRTPRAAAIAGIIFSLLMMDAQLLIRTSISTISLGPATNVVSHSNRISLALDLMPFAGIAFLWFIAVVRDRLGKFEDRFFATVFLGSGLLYIAMMFATAAVAGGLMRVLVSGAENLIQSGWYILARAEINQISNVYGTRMAAVFMFSTCRISLRTRIAPRWIAFLGYIAALALLLGVGTIDLIPLVSHCGYSSSAYTFWSIICEVCPNRTQLLLSSDGCERHCVSPLCERPWCQCSCDCNRAESKPKPATLFPKHCTQHATVLSRKVLS